ncbi:MAG: hypothetical protein EB141_18255, partial [Verrucomicrobia bacterium]|nr:hypothetical protein [Verrucomicrobiota bacterium]
MRHLIILLLRFTHLPFHTIRVCLQLRPTLSQPRNHSLFRHTRLHAQPIAEPCFLKQILLNRRKRLQFRTNFARDIITSACGLQSERTLSAKLLLKLSHKQAFVFFFRRRQRRRFRSCRLTQPKFA